MVRVVNLLDHPATVALNGQSGFQPADGIVGLVGVYSEVTAPIYGGLLHQAATLQRGDVVTQLLIRGADIDYRDGVNTVLDKCSGYSLKSALLFAVKNAVGILANDASQKEVLRKLVGGIEATFDEASRDFVLAGHGDKDTTLTNLLKETQQGRDRT